MAQVLLVTWDGGGNVAPMLLLGTELNELHPERWDVPVFESDGRTRIAIFRIGG